MYCRAVLPATLLVFLTVSTANHLSAVESVCPSNFDPDDNSWALASIEKVKDAEYIIRRRLFYQPDHKLRVVKKESSGCEGELLSFIVEGREERTVKGMGDSRSRIFFLKPENGEWKTGDRFAPQVISSEVLAMILYDAAGVEIARREFPMASLSQITKDEEGSKTQ